MPRVTFNQLVKHGINVYQEGDAVTVTDEEAEYFASHGWLEGTTPHQDPIQLDVPPTPSIDIQLEVDNGTLGTGDSNG